MAVPDINADEFKDSSFGLSADCNDSLTSLRSVLKTLLAVVFNELLPLLLLELFNSINNFCRSSCICSF